MTRDDAIRAAAAALRGNMISRRVHLARHGLGLTACGLIARGKLWRRRWSEAPQTPRPWRCARCRRVIAGGRRTAPQP